MNDSAFLKCVFLDDVSDTLDDGRSRSKRQYIITRTTVHKARLWITIFSVVEITVNIRLFTIGRFRKR